MEKKKIHQKYEIVTFWKNEVKKFPTVVRFRRKDGSIVTIKTMKRVSSPKKIIFLRKKK